MPDVKVTATIEPSNDIRDLVNRCRAGDEYAFAALFERFQDRLYDLAWAILRDQADAEDAVQDTFLRLFERIDRYRGASSFETWLVAVAVNVCRDRLRRRQVRRALSLDWLAPGWFARILGRVEDPAVAALQARSVARCGTLWTAWTNAIASRSSCAITTASPAARWPRCWV